MRAEDIFQLVEYWKGEHERRGQSERKVQKKGAKVCVIAVCPAVW